MFFKIWLQVHEFRISIKIIVLSSWWIPNKYYVVSTFHIIVIIYQSFDVKYFENFEKSPITTQFRTHFSYPFILHQIFSKFMFNLQ
jgi:hypothetical protein